MLEQLQFQMFQLLSRGFYKLQGFVCSALTEPLAGGFHLRLHSYRRGGVTGIALLWHAPRNCTHLIQVSSGRSNATLTACGTGGSMTGSVCRNFDHIYEMQGNVVKRKTPRFLWFGSYSCWGVLVTMQGAAWNRSPVGQLLSTRGGGGRR